MIDKSQCPAHTRTPWGESDHRYNHRLRYGLMCILSTIIAAVIVVAVVFFVERSRGHWQHINIDAIDDSSNKDTNDVTPLVMIAARGEDKLEMPKYPYFPPFHACGDQLQDCQRFYKPHFCCPPRMACYKSIYSPSGIYCCEDPDMCIVSDDHLPTCPGNTTECGRELGGGCCPDGTTCSPNGCLEFVDQNVGPRKTLFDQAPAVEAKMGTEEFTPTEPPQTTFTGIKFGETAYVSLACHALPSSMKGLMGVIVSVALAIVVSPP